jgi:uncharacterized protein YabN with tetrapyrrole methylase and pyrophosphatase domain
VFDGIPRSMPALAYAAKVGAKASKVGFDWPDVTARSRRSPRRPPSWAASTARARARRRRRTKLGDLLFAVVNVARHLRVDPELALRAATDKFRDAVRRRRATGAERSIDLRAADLPTLDALWDEVKAAAALSTMATAATGATNAPIQSTIATQARDWRR